MKRYIEELFEKRSRWVDANRDNGFDEGLSRLLSELYPDNAHFLYELLQNAEDAQASEVSFKLTKESLRFTHDGREFEKVDIDGITGIGTNKKKDDPNTIGTFGVGFKAVFSYTSSPHIFCDSCGFAITEMVCPIWLEHPNDLVEGMTRFEFPFDNPRKNQKLAFEEIFEGLDNFSSATLLFLHNIKEIRWEVVGEKEHFLRLEEEDEFETLRVYSVESDSKDHSARWLRLSAPSKEAPEQSVSIAFKLEAKKTKKNQHSFQIVETEGNFCIFFPADKETTKLKFHIHAPFNSTVARDSISYPKEDNISLRNQLVQLLVDSLPRLRDEGLLTPSFLEILPNAEDHLKPFYTSFMTDVVKEMKTSPLVPTATGCFAPGSELTRGTKGLREVVSEDDLKFLSGDEHQCWVIGALNNSRTDRFLKMLDIPEWTTSDLMDVISSKWGDYYDDGDAEWLKQKDVDWIRRLYLLLANTREAEYEIQGCAVILSSDGEYKKPNDIVLPIKSLKTPDRSEHSFVNPKILNRDVEQCKKIRDFLISLGVEEWNEKHEVECILKKHYRPSSVITPSFMKEKHLNHLKMFIRYWESTKDAELFSNYCIIGSEKKIGVFAMPSGTYLDEPIYKTSLSFVYASLKYPVLNQYEELGEQFVKFAKAIGVHYQILPESCRSYDNRLIDYSWDGRSSDYYEDMDYKLPAVLSSHILEETISVSLLTWNMMCDAKEKHLHARHRKNSRHTRQVVHSKLVQFLKETSWIPKKDGGFYKPCELTNDDLPKEFEYRNANGWLTAVEFGKDDAEQKAKLESEEFERQETTKRLRQDGINLSHEEMVEFSAFPKEDRQVLLDEYRSRKAADIELPKNDSKNHKRRKQKIEDGYGDAPDKESETRGRAVRQTPLSKEARAYLEPLNTNDDEQLICQMCNYEMPFKLRSGDYYFEAVQIVDDVRKEHHQLYLALCPVCAAKYKLLVKNDDACIGSFRADLLSLEDACEFSIEMHDPNLAPLSLRFTQKHLLDIQTILACESDDIANSDVSAITEVDIAQWEGDLVEALSNILLGEKIPLDIMNRETGDVIIPANRKITKMLIRKLAANAKLVEIDPSPLRIIIMGIIDEYRNKL